MSHAGSDILYFIQKITWHIHCKLTCQGTGRYLRRKAFQRAFRGTWRGVSTVGAQVWACLHGALGEPRISVPFVQVNEVRAVMSRDVEAESEPRLPGER